MFTIITSIMLFFMVASLVIVMASFLSKKTNLDREKSSPFECGFEPFSNSRIPFSLRFFILTIVFLIFDAEIAIILPLPMVQNSISVNSMVLIATIIIMTLLLGLIHEWNFGSLNWSN